MEYVFCYADSARGQYIPQYFAESVDASKLRGVTAKDLADLALGPNGCDWYWETWESVLDNAELHDGTHSWKLYQNGDLFCIRADAPQSVWDNLDY